MRIEIGPTGSLIKGDVLDSSQKALEAKLRDIDSQLYVTWNPHKFRGYGAWELRRRPDLKYALYQGSFQGTPIYELAYLETGINHIKDMAFLDYRILEWVRDADLWTKYGLGREQNSRLEYFKTNIERAEREYKARQKAKARAELKYQILQDRKIVRDFKERIASGLNPGLLGKHWK
jgi:hypothetical protein